MAEYNPFDSTVFADPYPSYRELLAGPRVVPTVFPNAWATSRWHEVRRVLSDQTFSADRTQATLLRQMPQSTGDPDLDQKLMIFDRLLLTIDPPDHTRIRRLVGSAFTPRRVDDLEKRIVDIADELCDGIAGAGEIDLIESFAYPLPVVVIAELLGLPPADRSLLKKWSDDVTLLLDPFPSMEALQRFGESIAEFGAYLNEQFELRRRRPADDLIGALVAARDGGDVLSNDELLALVVLLVAAGHETTTNLIGNGVIALAAHPEQRHRLVEEAGLVSTAIEELIRWDSPVQRTSRVATVPTQLGGAEILPGDLVITVLGAANRDPEVFSEPDLLVLDRSNANQNVSFGHGIHFCLGAPLAKLEGRVALPLLLRRFPRLDADVEGLTWKPSFVLRGVEKLPASLGA